MPLWKLAMFVTVAILRQAPVGLVAHNKMLVTSRSPEMLLMAPNERDFPHPLLLWVWRVGRRRRTRVDCV